MLEPGDQIDIWVVENPLGSGGMGSVYRCHNRSATRILAAVKVLEGSFRNNHQAEERFIREAEILFGLDHPNIVKVRNVRTDLDPPYLEMEFVEGESLEDKLRRGALPYDVARTVMRQLADAIAYLHRQGIRHRDIKPANVLVQEDGSTKLVDFGLAMETAHTRITQHGMTFGTVSYAPPEWVEPEKLDAGLWDLYAAGVVFYEMLTGAVAFPTSGKGSARQQAMQVIMAKQGHPPLDPGPAFQDDVRALVRDLTHSDTAQRLRDPDLLFERAASLEPAMARASGPTLAPTEEALAQLATGLGTLDTAISAPRSTGETRPMVGHTFSLDDERADDLLDELEATATAQLRRRRLVTTAGIAAALALIALLAVAGVAVAAWMTGVFTPAATTGDLAVSFTGYTGDLPIDVRLGEVVPSSSDDGTWSFVQVPAGDQELRWTVGHDCTVSACLGGCPAWCRLERHPLEVEGSDAVQVVKVLYRPPTPHAITLSVPSPAPAALTLDGAAPSSADAASHTWTEVLPGGHELVATAGTCPDDARGCASSGVACPPGCASVVAEISVSWDGDPVPAEVRVPEPTPVKAPTPIRPVVPVIRPVEPVVDPVVPPAVGKAAGKRITNAQLSKFLQASPAWSREAAVQSKLADDNYLLGWTGTAPPAGAEALPATNVSWYAADALCSGRGGLAPLDAEPLTWDEATTGIAFELRKGGYRSFDGKQVDKISKRGSNGFTAFRCNK